VSVAELFRDVNIQGRLKSEHLVALGVEACLAYDTPAAIFVPTASGVSARRIASLHLPVLIVAASANESTCQHLQFSRGVVAIHVPEEPASWTDFAREGVRAHDLPGRRLLLACGPSPANPSANHRLEIVDL